MQRISYCWETTKYIIEKIYMHDLILRHWIPRVLSSWRLWPGTTESAAAWMFIINNSSELLSFLMRLNLTCLFPLVFIFFSLSHFNLKSFFLCVSSSLQVIGLLPAEEGQPLYVTCGAKVRSLTLLILQSFKKGIVFRLNLHKPFNKVTRLNWPEIRTVAGFIEKLPWQTIQYAADSHAKINKQKWAKVKKQLCISH